MQLSIRYSMEIQMQNKILEELKEIKSLLTKKVSDRWLNINEVSDYTSLSHSTLRRAINRAELKVSRKTGKLLFNINDVKKWLSNG